MYLGRGHLLLGRQNLCYSTIIVLFGSPNCVFMYFVDCQLPNVENHCVRGPKKSRVRLNWKISARENNLAFSVVPGVPMNFGEGRCVIFFQRSYFVAYVFFQFDVFSCDVTFLRPSLRRSSFQNFSYS